MIVADDSCLVTDRWVDSSASVSVRFTFQNQVLYQEKIIPSSVPKRLQNRVIQCLYTDLEKHHTCEI